MPDRPIQLPAWLAAVLAASALGGTSSFFAWAWHTNANIAVLTEQVSHSNSLRAVEVQAMHEAIERLGQRVDRHDTLFDRMYDQKLGSPARE